MKKEVTIINMMDLIQLMAKKTNPYKIIWDELVWIYSKEKKDYISRYRKDGGLSCWVDITEDLSDEVIILESSPGE